ncbi:right-handed parallel beta-helix repeat-containing protein [Flavobacteriaceae bacterium TP-CH-4]|uniref:Right-handed parallel beta-helix repeat-containing protein n=1 Tax=Pelagihabitans pacificus TaxID=2696054 RepID=A0A967AR00_9FLAO|nr:right-handed parallel beta-helix repeat-containing protein [Pelagihabitans pacificus]NHF58584.1 right-handed parallel beta-helix repeat-containing protein [Pelagihabitans pacificus]
MPITVTTNGTTLLEAIAACRQLPKSERKITLSEGNHFVGETIRLGGMDSGLVIKGSGDARLYGGQRIANWEPKGDTLWRAKLPEVLAGKWDFRMLMVNDRYAERAHFPQKGFLIHETDFDVTWKSTYEGGFEREPTYEELTTLKFKPADIPTSFEPKNAELTVFHMWDESLVGVKQIDRGSNTIMFSNPAGWPPGAFAKYYQFDKRYVVWNTREGLQKPGQWYLDRAAGELVYWPQENEDMAKVEIYAPVLENVLVLEGDDHNDVADIELQDFTVALSNAPLMSGAFGAKLFDGAIALRGAKNCKLEGLTIKNVGAHGIKADGDDISITSCQIYNAGAGAIRITGSRANIHNNYIHDIGKTFPSAIALYVGATDPNVLEEWEAGKAYTDCVIAHNELHDVPYAAICAGGKNLVIEKNLIYRAMQNLYDGAGIYITFCTNSMVRNNFIRDIKDAPGAGTSAYYLDEKAIDCLVEGNVEINVPRASHNHIGKNNTFRNNFFFMKEKGRFSMERSEGYVFEKNVVVTGTGFEFYDPATCTDFNNNILFAGSGKVIGKSLNRYEVIDEFELPLTDGNTDEDPLILEYEEGKIRFAPNSIAHELGIQEVDVSDAGRIPLKETNNL